MKRETNAAEELDQLVSAHQTRNAEPALAALDPLDAELVAGLLAQAATTYPDPAFVARLEAQLAQQAQVDRQLAAARPPRLQARGRWPIPRHRPRYAVAAALLFLILISILAVPASRAALREMFYGFAFVEEAGLAQTPVAVVEPAIRSTPMSPLTLAQVQQQAPFPVRSPTWLPKGLALTGGHVQSEDNGASVVTLTYHWSDEVPQPGSPVLVLLTSNGDLAAPPLLPADRGEWVRIDGQAALYLHGGWRATSPATPEGILSGLTWDPTLDTAWLSWQAHGLTHLLHAADLGLERTEIVRIAQSLE